MFNSVLRWVEHHQQFIFLPDFKYFSPVFSKKYSGAADYFDVASKAIEKMFENVSYPVFDENGHLVKGVLIRHLVLPGLYRDSFKILDYLASKYDTQKLAVSIMSQYFPAPECASFPEINRRLTSLEYQSVRECMYYGENILAKFPERIIFSLGPNDADNLIENVSVTGLRDNTVYFTDGVKNTFQMKPYISPSPNELKRLFD